MFHGKCHLRANIFEEVFAGGMIFEGKVDRRGHFCRIYLGSAACGAHLRGARVTRLLEMSSAG